MENLIDLIISFLGGFLGGASYYWIKNRIQNRKFWKRVEDRNSGLRRYQDWKNKHG